MLQYPADRQCNPEPNGHEEKPWRMPVRQRTPGNRAPTARPSATYLWIFGFLGAHSFYPGKWITAILYLLTGGLFLIGIVYDYWTLNGQISEINSAEAVGD